MLVGAMAFFGACGGGQSASEEDAVEGGDAGAQRCPDVLEAELEPSGEAWNLDVTISSPYDSPEWYADGWRVLSPDGAVLEEHELMHVEGRDLENGYGGETVTVPVERG